MLSNVIPLRNYFLLKNPSDKIVMNFFTFDTYDDYITFIENVVFRSRYSKIWRINA
jgi:hypothetical protein